MNQSKNVMNSQGFEFRDYQEASALFVSANAHRVMGLSAPTGLGKSVIYTAAGDFMDSVVVSLTSSRILQDQLERDLGYHKMMGRSNYRCELSPRYQADNGICTIGLRCLLKDDGCSYYRMLEDAKKYDRVSTNYAFWMSLNRNNAFPINDIGLLVLDEAHRVLEILFKEVSCIQDRGVFKAFTGWDLPKMKSGEVYRGVALDIKEKLNEKYKTFKDRGDFITAVQYWGLIQEFAKVEGFEEIVMTDDGTTLVLSPGSLIPYFTKFFLDRARKVLFTSATLSEEVIKLLFQGVYDYMELPSIFPVRNRRIITVPSLWMNYNTTDAEIARDMVPAIDRIIDTMTGLKGIVHCNSYKLQDSIITCSKHKDIIYHNSRFNTKSVLEYFNQAEGSAVLLSPSVVEGHDFPYDRCNYQVICKTPFPSTMDSITQTVSKLVDCFVPYTTAQRLVQMSGRGVRNPDDYCPTFILDTCARGFIQRNKKLFPKWWLDAVVHTNNLREALRNA